MLSLLNSHLIKQHIIYELFSKYNEELEKVCSYNGEE